MLVAEELGLLCGGLLEGAGRQATGRRLSDLLHLGKVDIHPGPFVTEGAADDDFTPVFGNFADAGQIIGRQLP